MSPTSIQDLLADLAARGIELQAQGDRLRFRPRLAMTPELAHRLRAHKHVVLAILRAPGDAKAEAAAMIRRVREGGDHDLAEALAEAWEERLAICTTDGGLAMAEAEAVALDQSRVILDYNRSNR